MKSMLVLLLVALSGSVMAQTAASPVIYTGKVGSAPVQVAFDYLKDRVANEYGIGEYRELLIQQKSASAENTKKVSLALQMQGLLDDSVKAQRYQFTLNFNDELNVWLIDSVKQDWQCRRGASKGWTQKPCQ